MDSNILFVPATIGTSRPEVKAGTLVKLVERLTFEKYPDPNYLRQFLLTYRSFTDPETLIKLLFDRYMWVPAGDEAADFIANKQRPIRLRVYNVLKAWIQNHYHDFEVNKTLKRHLIAFLDEMNRTQMENPATNLQKELERGKAGGSVIGPSGAGSHLANAPRPILPKGTVRSVLDINPEELARQITLIEHQLFKEIQANEFLGQAWAKRRELAPNILRLINWSNRMIKWVATTIVTETDYRKRVNTLKLILDTADHCKRLNNFNGVMEIVSGLNSSACFRLRKTWGAIGKAYEQKFEDLKELVSRDKNFGNFREYLKNKISPPSIPYMGVYLTDLTFIEDGNPDKTPEGLINFEKRRHVAKVIDLCLSYQKEPYPLIEVPFIQEMLKTAKVLNEDDQYTHSHAREKKVGKGETVLVEPTDGNTLSPETEEEDFGELEQIPGYPFAEKDAPKNLVMNGSSISAASLAKLLERATPSSGHGADIVPIILMTYRRYTTPTQLIEHLRHRFFMPKPLHCTPELLKQFERKRTTPIRVRTIAFAKQWVDKYSFDLKNESSIREGLGTFLREAASDPVVSKTCQATLENLAKFDSAASSSSPQIVGLFPPATVQPTGQPVGAFLNLSPSDVANYLSWISRLCYEALRPSDFLGSATSALVEHMETLFGDIRVWIITELVRPKSTGQETLDVLVHVLTIFCELVSQRNFLAAHATHQALQRVEKTFKSLFVLVPPKVLNEYNTGSRIFASLASYSAAWDAASGAAVPAILLVAEKLRTLFELPDNVPPHNLINVTKMAELTTFLKSVLNFVKEDSPIAPESREVLEYLKEATVVDESEIDVCLETLALPEVKGSTTEAGTGGSNVKSMITDALRDPSFRKQLRMELLGVVRDDIFRIARQEMTLIGLRSGLISPKDGRNVLLDIVERHFPSAMINEWSHTSSEIYGFPHTFVLFAVDTTNEQFLVYVEPHLGRDELSGFLRVADIYKRENQLQEITLVCIASTIEEGVLRPALQAGVKLQSSADEKMQPSQVPLECAPSLTRSGPQPSVSLISSPPPGLAAGSPLSASSASSSAPSLASSSSSSFSSVSSSSSSPSPATSPSLRKPTVGGLMRRPTGLQEPEPENPLRGSRGRALPRGGSAVQPTRYLSTTALPREVGKDSPPIFIPGRPTSGTLDSATVNAAIGATPASPTAPATPTAPASPTPPPKPALPTPPPKPTPPPTPSVPVPSKPVEDWSTADVLQWLEAKGFSSVASTFSDNLITGPDLADMKETDLSEELGISDPSICGPLLAAIAELSA